MKEINGAGIIVFYDNRDGNIKSLDNDILYLTLLDYRNKYDFPKGGIDKGELAFDCALREADEEISLKKDYLERFLFQQEKNNPAEVTFLYKQCEGLVMYVAEIKKSKMSDQFLIVKPNEKTGYEEHSKFIWLTKENCKENLLSYLQEFLDWCDEEIRKQV
jgi:8-oxo-dGTP pyrophosphatase MutT (NUDIX family)